VLATEVASEVEPDTPEAIAAIPVDTGMTVAVSTDDSTAESATKDWAGWTAGTVARPTAGDGTAKLTPTDDAPAEPATNPAEGVELETDGASASSSVVASPVEAPALATAPTLVPAAAEPAAVFPPAAAQEAAPPTSDPLNVSTPPGASGGCPAYSTTLSSSISILNAGSPIPHLSAFKPVIASRSGAAVSFVTGVGDVPEKSTLGLVTQSRHESQTNKSPPADLYSVPSGLVTRTLVGQLHSKCSRSSGQNSTHFFPQYFWYPSAVANKLRSIADEISTSSMP
jgi:hypothetical protein